MTNDNNYFKMMKPVEDLIKNTKFKEKKLILQSYGVWETFF